MRKIMLVWAAWMTAVSAMGATGWYSDYILVSVDGGADQYYWIGTDPSYGTRFNGADLGAVVQGGTFELGADMRYWSDTFDRDGGAFYWMVDAGTVNEVIWTQTYMGSSDYQGLEPTENKITGGLDVGTHTVSVWAKSWGAGQGDSWLTGVTGENYTATFSVIPEPTTLVLLGLGVAGLLAYCRRR